MQPYCKICKKSIDKELYDSNRVNKKEKNRIRTKKNYEITTIFIRRYKKLCKCSNCNESRWYLLDFHHLYDKKYAISSMKALSIKSIKEEIRKCQILCSNCHRELHYFENNK